MLTRKASTSSSPPSGGPCLRRKPPRPAYGLWGLPPRRCPNRKAS